MNAPVLLMVVEDEPLILLGATDALENGGYETITAQSGEEAVGLLDKRISDIAGLITDVRLGSGPSGWEVARHARSLNAGLPIVYTTGDSAADWPVEGVPNSIVVQKPYAAAQLVTAISMLLTAPPVTPPPAPPGD